jgi:hypothetical protein
LPLFKGDPSHAIAGDSIAVEVLAGLDAVSARDWHGAHFEEAARRALAWGGGHFASKAGEPTLCGLFWRAVIRGSAQGAAYVLESARWAARQGRLAEFLAKA